MAPLKEGAKAPAFKAKNIEGKFRTMQDFAGKPLVLYFYPKDFTPGCTKEACSLRDGYKKLEKKGVQVVGVSPNDEVSHKKFIDKYKLPFELLADPDHKVAKTFGVWVEKSMFGKKYMGILRTTFIIDKNKIIKKIITKVDTANHADQVLESL